MLLASEKTKLNEIDNQLNRLSDINASSPSLERYRKYFALQRELLHLFEDVVIRINKIGKNLQGKDGEKLRILASRAISALGGVAEPSPISLKDYNHDIYGPFLGVSDEGGAARFIRQAALCSPKMKVLGYAPPIEVGVAHDAERLAAVGEVAVGPEEYRDIRIECQGSILTSTNVGTRLNLRYYKMRPIVEIASSPLESAIGIAVTQLKKLVEPFWRTPDGTPRPVTLFVSFMSGTPYKWRREVLIKLKDALSRGTFCNPQQHKLGILVRATRGWRGVKMVQSNIDLVKMAGLNEIAIQGVVSSAAESKISMPGILNYFSPMHVEQLQKYVSEKQIVINPLHLVDPDTVARHVWSSLQVARNMGLELGKYGLFPLTLEESDEVMGHIQKWFADWTAAPVFYLDFPMATQDKVYTEKNIVQGAKRWLDCVSQHKIPIVLFDTADKDKGRKLLKAGPDDHVGILTLDQIREIDHYARTKEIRCLWAGGISTQQVLQFGKLKVFGIYVTSSAADIRPVTKKYARDPMITAEKMITFEGVCHVKLLLESGFLITNLMEYRMGNYAKSLEGKALQYIDSLLIKPDSEKQDDGQRALELLAGKAWEIHYKRHGVIRNSDN